MQISTARRKTMNNTCSKSAMSVAGVRAAALGGRGLLRLQRQCKFITGTKGSPFPLSARSSLSHLHWPRATRPTHRSTRPSSLLLVQYSVQDQFPPATTYVLLNTKGTNLFCSALARLTSFKHKVYGDYIIASLVLDDSYFDVIPVVLSLWPKIIT